jgi:lipid A 3-O-deacylase
MFIIRRRRSSRLSKPLALLACIGLVGGAGIATAEDAFWSLQVENDLFGSGDDRFYTNGLEISRLTTGSPPPWLAKTANHLPFFRLGDAQAVQFSIGSQIFTPEDTRATELIVDDRPYAGWLYVNAELLSRFSTGTADQAGNLLGITLGIVGPAAQGEAIQNGWHDLIGVERSLGWDNQLRNEIGVNLNYSRRWQFFRSGLFGSEFEIAPHITASLGNVYTYGGSGIMFRLGQGLRNDYAPPNIRPGFPGVPYIRPSKNPGWYLFAGAEGRAVARNLFLDGNTFVDSHSVDKKPFVADLQFGLAFQKDGVRIALSNVWRSPEFDGQKENTQFGAINLSFALNR